MCQIVRKDKSAICSGVISTEKGLANYGDSEIVLEEFMDFILEIVKTIAETPWIVFGFIIILIINYFYKYCTLSELEKAIEYKPSRHMMRISKEILIPTGILIYFMMLANLEVNTWINVILTMAILTILGISFYLKYTLKTDNIRHVKKNIKVLYFLLLALTIAVSAFILYTAVQILSEILILDIVKSNTVLMKDSPLILLIDLIRYRDSEFILTLNNKLIMGYILLLLVYTIVYILIRGFNLFIFNILKLKFTKTYNVRTDLLREYTNVRILNRDSLFIYLNDPIKNKFLAVRIGDIHEIELIEEIEK